MKISSITLKNFRSFVDSGRIELGQVNVLIGPNNSGKSSVIRGLHQLQQGLPDLFGDVRVGSNDADIVLTIEDISTAPGWAIGPESGTVTLNVRLNTADRRGGNLGMNMVWDGRLQRNGDLRLPNAEPNHFIVPFLSKRKTSGYGEDIREQHVIQITSDMTNLAAKLSRLANPAFPAHRKYADACEAVLGFVVTAIPAQNGQRPGIYLPDQRTVPIEQMGEGVPNIVQLLCHLAVSKDKLFLLEEPENDLHPAALKVLLDLVLSSARDNQFVVSTHSNIVVSHLCSDPNSRLFRVSSQKGLLPTVGTIEAVPPTPDARMRVLRELGYSFSDYDLWDGWLLLEESSAERIVRDYLIPWFVPRLGRLRTVAAGGVTNVEPAFVDLYRLMLFTHLQPAYVGRAWVRVDGDEPGKAMIQRLRERFPTVDPAHFDNFGEANFERYYPAEFRERVEAVLSIADRQARRPAKLHLLREVMAWLDADVQRARAALHNSALPIIRNLEDIQTQLEGN